MKIRLFLFVAICIAAASIHAGTLNIIKTNAQAINCLFSTNCTVTLSNTTATFITNMLSTNVTLRGLLLSRTFPGNPGSHEANLFGYEYRLGLTKLTGAKSLSINSMTLDFSPHFSFTCNGQSNLDVWVIPGKPLAITGPTSASVANSKVTFNFNPPLTYISGSSEEVTTCFFGMISSNPPPATPNGWATFKGSIRTSPLLKPFPFNSLCVQVRRP